MPLGDFSSREPIINQYLGIRPLTTQRNSIQSQRRFHKKLFKPKLLQQRNDRERKFPYTTNKKSNSIRKKQSILKYSRVIDYGLAKQLERISINKDVNSSLFF
ncbi:hypothetical protein U3516DRAFT_901054, partial [Neocallimastix sp. 'constans']